MSKINLNTLSEVVLSIEQANQILTEAVTTDYYNDLIINDLVAFPKAKSTYLFLRKSANDFDFMSDGYRWRAFKTTKLLPNGQQICRVYSYIAVPPSGNFSKFSAKFNIFYR